MNQFKKLNNYVGWTIFLIASFVYLSTIEQTASLWDCGEFISAAYKLEVVHEPGAPFFLIMGRIFTLFTSDVTQVAAMVNSMSAIASSFTILFLFWTITAFGRKIYFKDGEAEQSKIFAVLGAGVVGALAYTFSDSFWFSAVEGEVYAMSSFFTAVTFWCILKWEEVAGSPHSSKWLVLIAYLIGLSIGVHLLSLLAIPAMGMIYYFKNNKYSHKGALIAFSISSAIILFIQGVFIPKAASLMGAFDVFFVNSLNMPFNSGIIFYLLLLVGLIAYGLSYTKKHNKAIWNTVILGFMMLLIGYSSYAMVLIRSNANTPINMSAPDDPLKLADYLARKQYGEVAPVLFGRYYSDSPKIEKINGRKRYIIKEEEVYKKNLSRHKYDQATTRQYEYENNRFFSRMYSPSSSPDHVGGYQLWAPHNKKNIKFSDNLKFFFEYQIGWSYMRYFMWNFAGRQNDVMNMDGNSIYGNWESGIGYSDEGMPPHLKDNKAKNHYYFLPLILGLIGMFFHFKKQKTDAFSVLLFFLFTGVFIILYLNVPPEQPRERDYAYVGSFYAFAIWIGIGVLAIFDKIKEKLNGKTAAILATSICLLAVPVLMASENWDDHNRTGRTIALDVGVNYLESCDSNAIIFSNGDNDTYPLWFAQEVEGIGTDIMNVNMSLLNSPYYIQQIKRKRNDADRVPSVLTNDFYKKLAGSVTITENKKKRYMLITQAIEQIKQNMTCPKYIKIPIPNNPNEEKKSFIELTIYRTNLNPNDIALLDILSNFNWERPLYFMNAQQTLGLFILTDKQRRITDPGLLNYIQEEGAVSRLVPFNTNQERINIDKSYDLLMNKYSYGNLSNPNVNYCNYTDRSIRGFRSPFVALSQQLIKRGDNEKAESLANKYFESIPYSTGYLDQVSVLMASIYVTTNPEKGEKIINELLNEYQTQRTYLELIANLDGQGKYLLQHTIPMLNQLNQYSKTISDNKEKDQNEADGKGRFTNAQLKKTEQGINITESGLEYEVINSGGGTIHPTDTSEVRFHYTLKASNGTAILESTKNNPSFNQGKRIKLSEPYDGLPQTTEALKLMKEGDIFKFLIPTNTLNLTEEQKNSIGPNLIHELELLEIL